MQFHSISLEWPTCGNAPRAAYKVHSSLFISFFLSIFFHTLLFRLLKITFASIHDRWHFNLLCRLTLLRVWSTAMEWWVRSHTIVKVNGEPKGSRVEWTRLIIGRRRKRGAREIRFSFYCCFSNICSGFDRLCLPILEVKIFLGPFRFATNSTKVLSLLSDRRRGIDLIVKFFILHRSALLLAKKWRESKERGGAKRRSFSFSPSNGLFKDYW